MMLELYELLHRLRDLGLKDPEARSRYDFRDQVLYLEIEGKFRGQEIASSFAINEITLRSAISQQGVDQDAIAMLEGAIRGWMDQGN
jgi:hypothetical protein